MKPSPHKPHLFYREQLHTSVTLLGVKLLTIRLKSIESTVDVIIAIFNAKPENFKPQFFPAVQIFNFPMCCTWVLRTCSEELVPVETFNSDRHQPYDVTEKIQLDYRERSCTLISAFRELKQPRSRRQQERHKFAYLTIKKKNVLHALHVHF